MTVALHGPAGYDFQDLVCIELALRLEAKSNPVMFIELPDSEDAKIEYDNVQGRATIEVQIKKTASDFGLQNFVDYLAHFSNFSCNDFLLKRIFEKENSCCLLVLGGRCLDETHNFVVDFGWDGVLSNAFEFKYKQAKTILRKFADVKINGKSTGNLHIEREQATKSFVNGIDTKDFQAFLNRILVLEKVSNNILIDSCKKILLDKYQIPSDIAEKVILELRQKVKDAKSNKQDFMRPFRQVLNTYATKLPRQLNYVERGNEQLLIDTLSSKRVLLLSGPPKCGKTWVARHIRDQFAAMGYQVELGFNISEAERFLSLDINLPRLFVLDDPFGEILKHDDAANQKSKLGKLISSLSSHRRLVVTQRQEILFELCNTVELSQCSLVSNNWVSLDTNNKDFLIEVWNTYVSNLGISKKLNEKVQILISEGEHFEVGSLRHLASINEQLSGDETTATLLRLARPDANELAAELSQNFDMSCLLTALALCTERDKPIRRRELAFILSDESNTFPTWKNRQFQCTAFGNVIESPLPQYVVEPVINCAFGNNFDKLERKNYIESNLTRFNFTHSFYRTVAELTIKTPITRHRKFMFDSIKRGLFCMDGITSNACARNLHWCIEIFSNETAQLQKVIALAIEAFSHTLFVNTRDTCYFFLVKHEHLLEGANREDMTRWSSIVSNLKLDDVRWVDGQAWFFWGDEEDGLLNLSRFSGSANRIPEIVISDYLKDLSPEDASKHLAYVSECPQDFSTQAVRRFLTFSESVIRGAAARIWFSVERENDEEIVKFIMADEHPHVVLQAIEGMLSCENSISKFRFQNIICALEDSLSSPLVSAVLFQQIRIFNSLDSDFSNEDAQTKFNRLQLFGLLIPSVLRNIRKGQIRNSSTLGELFSEMLRSSIEITVKERAIDSWVDWLPKEVGSGGLPCDYVMGVFDDLILQFKTHEEARLRYLEKLSQTKSTSIILVFIQFTMRHWEILSSKERQLVAEVISKQSEDYLFRKAIALINAVGSDGLSIVPIGGKLLYDQADSYVTELPADLLKLCILLYCKDISIAYYIGLNGARNTSWHQVIRLLAARPEHHCFEIAISYLRRCDIPAFNLALVEAIKVNSQKVFEVMLKLEAELQGLWNSEGWKILLRSEPDVDRCSEWMKTLVKYSPAVIDGLSEVKLWLGEELQEEFCSQLIDLRHFQLMHTFLNLDAEFSDEAVCDIFVGILQIEPPLFGDTLKSLEKVAKKLGFNKPRLQQELDSNKKKCLENSRRLTEKLKEVSNVSSFNVASFGWSDLTI